MSDCGADELAVAPARLVMPSWLTSRPPSPDKKSEALVKFNVR
jgi:hypothetical protein